MESFKDEDEKVFFYRESGYYKKRNQVVANINMKALLEIFEKYYGKAKKKNTALTEEEYLMKFIESLEMNIEYYREWESKFISKRKEFMKAIPHMEDNK